MNGDEEKGEGKKMERKSGKNKEKERESFTEDMELEHFSHIHNLIYNEQEEINDENNNVCCGCKQLISGPSYNCFKCSFFLHKACAELPRHINPPLHRKHPLTLLMVQPYSSGRGFCDLCSRSLDNMVYNCSLCQFDLDIDCALKPCVSGTPTGNYEHQFFHLMKSINFTCDACGNEGTQSPHICILCQIMVHKECVSRPKAIRITEHSHVLTHFYFLQNSESIEQSCGICQSQMNLDHGGYYCSYCDYVVHVDCASTHLIGVVDEPNKLGTDALGDLSIESTSDDDADKQLATENKQFSHEHVLTIIDQVDDKKPCVGCMLPLSSASITYGCLQCDMFLHKECSELSTKIKHPLHRHSLTLLLKAYCFDGLFKCNACEQYCHGFCYHCEKCDFYLDIRCSAIISTTLKHRGHDHLLRLVLSKRNYSCHCSACYKTKFSYFECEDCNFCLDFRCATLPISVRHRFDEKHPLKLTYNFVSDSSFDHYCEVCEMRIDPGTYVFKYAPWFYWCEECDISIHPECVLGRYPYIKFDRSSSYSLSGIHSHGLTLVQKPFILVKKRKFYAPCDHCAEPFDEDLALQCGQCNFIIHRKGPCFAQNFQQ